MLTRKRLAARLNSSWDLRSSLQSLSELGLGGVVLEAVGEIAPKNLSGTGRREIRALVRSAELSIQAVALPMRRSIAELTDWDKRLSRLAEAMNLAYELGASKVNLAPGPVPLTDSEKQRYQAHLIQLADLADHHGVQISLETGLEQSDSLITLLHEVRHPVLRIVFDPGRLALTGQNNEKFASDAHDLISMVVTTDPEFLGLGNISRGKTTNWNEILEIIEELGYRGPLLIWPDANLSLTGVISEMGRRLGVTPRFS